MFIAAPFTIANKWKQAKCPSTDAEVDVTLTEGDIFIGWNMARKKNAVLINATTQMSLENIRLSERQQTQRPHLCDFVYINVQNRQIQKDRK